MTRAIVVVALLFAMTGLAEADHWRVFLSVSPGCQQWSYVISFDHESPCHSQPISFNCFPQFSAKSFKAVQYDGYATLYFYSDETCQTQANFWNFNDNVCYGQCMLTVSGTGYQTWTNCYGCGDGQNATSTSSKTHQD